MIDGTQNLRPVKTWLLQAYTNIYDTLRNRPLDSKNKDKKKINSPQLMQSSTSRVNMKKALVRPVHEAQGKTANISFLNQIEEAEEENTTTG